jgi:DNA (cytosine-5)-methyltransferase 1
VTLAVDLFDGCGGWTEGARKLGLHPVGIELDRDAIATAVAAGGHVVRGDITKIDPHRFGRAELLIASPPCTDFSTAGTRSGVDGETGKLIFEVPRWVEAIRPRWIACEQVPPVLAWWERFAHDFARLGYKCWTGILNAADYGVPQTRQRAFLLASLDSQPRPPEPTHARHPMPGLFGDDRLAWVSMADALGWDGFEAQYKRGAGMIERHGERPARDCAQPAPTLTGSALGAGAGAKMSFVRTGNNSHVTSRTGSRAGEGGVRVYERSTAEPAPTLDTKVGSAWRVVSGSTIAGGELAERTGDDPAFTVTSRADLWKLHTNRGQDADGNRQTCAPSAPAPALSAKAGGQWEFGEGNGSTMGQGIKLTVEDALILQSFPRDYQMCGTKTSQFRQIGNAVPPLLARRVLESVMS